MKKICSPARRSRREAASAATAAMVELKRRRAARIDPPTCTRRAARSPAATHFRRCRPGSGKSVLRAEFPVERMMPPAAAGPTAGHEVTGTHVGSQCSGGTGTRPGSGRRYVLAMAGRSAGRQYSKKSSVPRPMSRAPPFQAPRRRCRPSVVEPLKSVKVVPPRGGGGDSRRRHQRSLTLLFQPVGEGPRRRRASAAAGDHRSQTSSQSSASGRGVGRRRLQQRRGSLRRSRRAGAAEGGQRLITCLLGDQPACRARQAVRPVGNTVWSPNTAGEASACMENGNGCPLLVRCRRSAGSPSSMAGSIPVPRAGAVGVGGAVPSRIRRRSARCWRRRSAAESAASTRKR